MAVDDDSKGAPPDFAGRVLSNDNDVKPKWDTDEPEGTFHESKGAKLDISNPPASDVNPHPLHQHFVKHPPRSTFGRNSKVEIKEQ